MKSMFYVFLMYIGTMNVLFAQKRVIIDKVDLNESKITLTPDSIEKFYKEIVYYENTNKGSNYFEVLCDNHIKASYVFHKQFVELVIFEDKIVRKVDIPKPIDEWDMIYEPTEQLRYFNIYPIKEICFHLQNWHQIFSKTYFLKEKFKSTQKQLDVGGFSYAYRIEKNRKDTSLIINNNFILAPSCNVVDTLTRVEIVDFLENFRENVISVDERSLNIDDPSVDSGDETSGSLDENSLDAIVFYDNKNMPIGYLNLDMRYNLAIFYFKNSDKYECYSMFDYGSDLRKTVYHDLNYNVFMKLLLRKVNNMMLDKMDIMEYRLWEDERDKGKK